MRGRRKSVAPDPSRHFSWVICRVAQIHIIHAVQQRGCFAVWAQ
jgi:hypothetical protein